MDSADSKPVTGESVAHLADVTSVGRLYAYLMRDPNITAMFSVNEPELKLEDVAAAFINGDTVVVADWLHANMISDDIPEDFGAAVMCIRVEPFYVYKPNGRRYE